MTDDPSSRANAGKGAIDALFSRMEREASSDWPCCNLLTLNGPELTCWTFVDDCMAKVPSSNWQVFEIGSGGLVVLFLSRFPAPRDPVRSLALVTPNLRVYLSYSSESMHLGDLLVEDRYVIADNGSVAPPGHPDA